VDDFDLVIVGGGSAGCALAGRLAARTSLRIGLVEAGPDYGPLRDRRWPAELLDAQRSPTTHDWGFAQSRARVLGGCSTHNQCGIFRALPGDYDRWAAGASWTDAALTSFLDEVTRVLPLHQHRGKELTVWQRTFLDTAAEAGYPPVADVNNPEPAEGAAPFLANIREGIRWNAALAFLEEVRPRANLTIVADTLVDRLVMDHDRATALVGRSGGAAVTFSARRFVLCAGTYGSPAILMRSGIGPPDDLDDLEIPVQVPLTGVGRNLHDHPGVALDYEPTVEIRRQCEEEMRGGRFYEAQVMLKARSPRATEHWDLNVFPYQMTDENGASRFLLMAFVLTPTSRGRVRLRGRDPGDPPEIDLQFLSDEAGHDLAVLLSGVRVLRRLAETRPLRAAIVRQLVPERTLETHGEIAQFVRAHVTDDGHPVGTCRLGPPFDCRAVVGSEGRVYGTENVLVADASIIPVIPRAPINLSCMLIGLRVAALLEKGEPEPP
jgi:choline dehydrogenase-like flavoprotein